MREFMSRKQAASVAVLALDIVLINLAFWFAYVIRYQLGFPYRVDQRFYAPFSTFIPFAALLTFLCLITFRIDGLYEHRRGWRLFDDIYRLSNDTMTSIVIIMAITFFVQPLYYSRGMLLLAGVIIVALLGTARIARYLIEAGLRRRGIGVERVLIVGAGEVGRAVMRSILADPSLGYQIVGYVDDDPSKGESELGRIKGLGDVERIRQIIPAQNIAEVIVTLPWMYHRKIMQIVEECERENVRVRVVPDVFQQRMHRLDLESLNGIPLIGLGPTRMSSGAVLIKRVMDLFLTILALPLLAIVYVGLAIAIKLDSPGPVIFTQRRVGRDGREFEVYKFRSMIVGAEKMQAELADLNEADGPLFKIKSGEGDPRVTRVGRFIRRNSIDELPQLINILRGEMSLIGPRPGTPEEVVQYKSWQRKRLSVKPGMTGLWQVSGRSEIPFDEMCLLDIFYIENWSLDLDIRILLRTIPRVLFASGAY
jgi:exopolysaccharide biosynthesis polyprenyl glycosylphosphotransferase